MAWGFSLAGVVGWKWRRSEASEVGSRAGRIGEYGGVVPRATEPVPRPYGLSARYNRAR